MRSSTKASILIPTRARPDYLEVTLRSVAPQAQEEDAELLVVSDGPDPVTREVAARHGARLVELRSASALNAVRNRAIEEAKGELLVFVDDDVIAPPGWLDAYLRASSAHPDHDVFGGPIRPLLEGGGPRACGREKPPITSLDFGSEDRDVQIVWGANMAIRRRAFERLGGFDETIIGTGDEEEWITRYVGGGKPVRYVARAGITHRRSASDSSLSKLARTAYARGKGARRFDERKSVAPSMRQELITLAGCGWHAVRRRCALGIVAGAHSAGRLRQAITERRA